MDKDTREARKKAIDALVSAIGFWGVDPLEIRVYGTLFLSPYPLSHTDLANETGADDEEVHDKVKLLERLGAVRSLGGERPGCPYYEAESDFFEILQTVLRERRELEMGRALQEITALKAYFGERFDDEGEPELEFLSKRLDKLDRAIKLIDKTMFSLGALASLTGLLRGK